MRDFRDAKSRLDFLDEECRAELAKRCFRRTIEAVAEVDGAAGYVLTSSDSVKSECRERAIEVVDEPGEPAGFRSLIRSTISRLPSSTFHGVLMADLPYVSARDVKLAIDAANEGDVVLGPDRHLLGTNLLLMRDMLPDLLMFGAPDSYLQHEEMFRGASREVRSLRLFGLGFDIDTPEDYATLSRDLRL
jgi:2-phospho-L-lactate guanylyltransferase